MNETDRNRNIVFVASECFPYAKTGGLADVIGALPVGLENRGHHCAVIIPKYRAIADDMTPLVTVKKQVSLNFSTVEMEFDILMVQNSPVLTYLIDCPKFFDRPTFYDQDGVDYPDNGDRFCFFSLAALTTIYHLKLPCDVIHCHDWQTGLIPTILSASLRRVPEFLGVATVFTIHNMAYHGSSDPALLDRWGISRDLFTADGLEFWGKVNLLKAGIRYADMVSTVSPSYAQEIQTTEYGCGLAGLLRARSTSVVGIVNGIDMDTWNPQTDPYIASLYGPETINEKSHCRDALVKLAGFDGDQSAPILATISRFITQKGIDLVLQALPALMDIGARVCMLGTGDSALEQSAVALESQYPGRVKIWLTYSEALSHQIYAGSDMFLMPSRFEPCGLTQLIAMRYGTVPIVRWTGGLIDTVIDVESHKPSGTGFGFGPAHSDAVVTVCQRAINTWKTPLWQEIQRRGMVQDFSWDRVGNAYELLYQRAISSVPR